MLLTKLRELLTRFGNLASSLGIDTTPLSTALNRLNELERSFLVVRPFAKGLTELSKLFAELSSSENPDLGSYISRIASILNTLVDDCRKASRVLRWSLVVLSVAMCLASLVILPPDPATKMLGFVASSLTIVTAMLILFGSILYMNIVVFVLPILTTFLLVESVLHLSTSMDTTALIVTSVALATFLLSVRVSIKAVDNYRRALLAVTSIELMLTSIEKKRREEEVRRPIEDVEKLFRETYGDRAEELLEYLKDLEKLR